MLIEGGHGEDLKRQTAAVKEIKMTMIDRKKAK